jgi:hypothetical protein
LFFSFFGGVDLGHGVICAGGAACRLLILVVDIINNELHL